MSWKPIIRAEEKLKNKVLIRCYDSSVGIYIPIATRKMIGIKQDCFCIVNYWKSETESDNRHKLFIQFMDDEQKTSRRLYHGKINLPLGIIRKHMPSVNGAKGKYEVPVITDKGNVLIDMRDLHNDDEHTAS